MALSVVNGYKIVSCGVEIAVSEEHARDGETLAVTGSREEPALLGMQAPEATHAPVGSPIPMH